MTAPGLVFEWDRSFSQAQLFLRDLPRSYQDSVRAAMRDFGQETLSELKLRISSGSVQPGLNAEYSAWKQSKGFDERTLLRTHGYLNSLRLVSERSGFTIYVDGVEPILEDPETGRTIAGRSRNSYALIAFWLEYGTQRMPARPHWEPTARRARARFPHVVRKAVQQAFERSRSKYAVDAQVSGYSGSVTLGNEDFSG